MYKYLRPGSQINKKCITSDIVAHINGNILIICTITKKLAKRKDDIIH